MKKTRILTLMLSLLCLLCSCGREAEVGEVLAAMCDSQPSLPAGRIYLSGAEAGEAAFAEEELLAVLYGGGELPIEFEVINAFAFRLSEVGTPHEFAVFLCVSAQDAYDVAQMCLRRTDTLRRGYLESEWEEMAGQARVCVEGRAVLLAVGEDALTAIEAGRRALRGK